MKRHVFIFERDETDPRVWHVYAAPGPLWSTGDAMTDGQLLGWLREAILTSVSVGPTLVADGRALRIQVEVLG